MQERVSNREFDTMMENILFTERSTECEGEFINDADYEDLIDLWECKGYNREDDNDFRITFIKYIDRLGKDQLDKRFEEMKVNNLHLYYAFCDEYYKEVE